MRCAGGRPSATISRSRRRHLVDVAIARLAVAVGQGYVGAISSGSGSGGSGVQGGHYGASSGEAAVPHQKLIEHNRPEAKIGESHIRR